MIIIPFQNSFANLLLEFTFDSDTNVTLIVYNLSPISLQRDSATSENIQLVIDEISGGIQHIMKGCRRREKIQIVEKEIEKPLIPESFTLFDFNLDLCDYADCQWNYVSSLLCAAILAKGSNILNDVDDDKIVLTYINKLLNSPDTLKQFNIIVAQYSLYGTSIISNNNNNNNDDNDDDDDDNNNDDDNDDDNDIKERIISISIKFKSESEFKNAHPDLYKIAEDNGYLLECVGHMTSDIIEEDKNGKEDEKEKDEKGKEDGKDEDGNGKEDGKEEDKPG